jgi:hypothetical protein
LKPNIPLSLIIAATPSGNCSSRLLTFTANDLSALKDEPNVWCAEDFCTKVTFELKGIQFPNSIYQSYTTDWNKIEELLKNELKALVGTKKDKIYHIESDVNDENFRKIKVFNRETNLTNN